MTMSHPTIRRVLRDVARLSTVGCAVMLVFGLAGFLDRTNRVSAAGEFKGAVVFTNPDGGAALTGGGSAPFGMAPPANAACPGGASGVPSYRWQTFIVSAAVDVSNLTYTGAGPVPVAGNFVAPLSDGGLSPIVNQNPVTSPIGLITNIPVFSFATFSGPEATNRLAPGQYKIGIACTQANATVSYWESTITVAASTTDTPAGIAWTVSASAATTTTAAATTTTAAAAATTTTVRPSTATTTTTATGATTTTVAAATTTTVVGGATTTTIGFVSLPASGGGFNTGSNIPVTGPSHVLRITVWAILMLVFGRMAVLMARPVKVVRADER